jgi:hypothetical protein
MEVVLFCEYDVLDGQRNTVEVKELVCEDQPLSVTVTLE